MRPRIGQMLVSTVDTTAVIVVRCSDQEVEITCGGAALAEAAGPGGPVATGTPDPDLMGGAVLGKRYADEEAGLELLCTKQGQGTLAVNGVPLPMKSPKPLPASD
ncbi:hypothetical protein ACOT81_06430 [Streptomyces sp. WI04-05B]|uniref:hypothetical protein n=1 Tax=Streptomyces TaxID=1883 RepID=UPI0029A4D1C3|nr:MULTISPECIES: hypothetical protein [unclassified Streptomyces]MDX2545029.1 hypothetical protein [Streptomyces sp. WI04-05B]MDX2587520.1 hypothetical protein [Streptomyces sp. WI04-05A]MDX3748300.1 hypothetical protein [Streptomyces sp. AK08-02]